MSRKNRKPIYTLSQAEAERLIRKAGGHVAAVHSEDKNFAMYEHLGYRITSELFDNGTHGWLVKALN